MKIDIYKEFQGCLEKILPNLTKVTNNTESRKKYNNIFCRIMIRDNFF